MRFIQFLTENDDWEDSKPDEFYNVEKALRKMRGLEHESDLINHELDLLKKAGKVFIYYFKFDIPDELKDKTKYKVVTCSFPTSDGMYGLARRADWEWMAVFIPRDDVQLQQQVIRLINRKLAAHQEMAKEWG